MSPEFFNLLELFRSRNPENIVLASELAPNFAWEFQVYFDCTVEEYLDLFSFLNEYTIEAKTNFTANPLEMQMFHFMVGVGYKDFKRLPQGLQALKNVDLFSVYSTTLESLPNEIFSLKNLQELFICVDKLKYLSPQISGLEKLRDLTIHDTQIRSLPSEIGKLQNLHWLNIWRNSLETLPSEIGDLIHLDELILHDNQLQVLPPEIGNLKNLKYLSLENNKLQTLPHELQNLNLDMLVLTGNPLQIEDIDILIENSTIETIIFGYYKFFRHESDDIDSVGW